MTTLMWFREDLRLTDNAALLEAACDPEGFVALFLLDEVSPGVRALGAASRWWLHHSLTALREDLAAHGIPLVLARGAAGSVLPALVEACGAERVVWNRRYGTARAVDARLRTVLADAGVRTNSHPGNLLVEPWQVRTGTGGPYRVYSAFWKACLDLPLRPPQPRPRPRDWVAAAAPVLDDLSEWRLAPTRPDWSGGLARRWTPGERGATERLTRFLDEGVTRYRDERDIPAAHATSDLSPHLRWGEVSVGTVWHRAVAGGADVGAFLGELGWREFAWHTAFHRGDLHLKGLDPRFDAFAWREPEPVEWEAWRTGSTGFPLVDAGMRELWTSGAMHNRVRMVAASFLTKNLLVDWRVGEAWFWDTLVDADEASNPFNWQWVAGCGADAAPYFRVFNPVLQEKKFDPDGTYVARWAPDSSALGQVVDLPSTRARALAAWEQVRHPGKG